MSRKHDRAAGAATPRHVTVKAAGPLDPWRLPAVVVGVALTMGGPLLEATRTGHRLDEMLLRAFVIGLVAWVLLGVVNKLLVQATVLSTLERTRLELSTTEPLGDPDRRPTTPGTPGDPLR